MVRVIGPLLGAAAFVWAGLEYGFLRTAVAVLMFGAILALGARYIRKVVSVPPEPEVVDVADYGLKYVCSVCGLELRVEVAARDKAPSHCMEPMVLVRTGGRPPLRSV